MSRWNNSQEGSKKGETRLTVKRPLPPAGLPGAERHNAGHVLRCTCRRSSSSSVSIVLYQRQLSRYKISLCDLYTLDQHRVCAEWRDIIYLQHREASRDCVGRRTVHSLFLFLSLYFLIRACFRFCSLSLSVFGFVGYGCKRAVRMRRIKSARNESESFFYGGIIISRRRRLDFFFLFEMRCRRCWEWDWADADMFCNGISVEGRDCMNVESVGDLKVDFCGE